jgi:hypothetical protein
MLGDFMSDIALWSSYANILDKPLMCSPQPIPSQHQPTYAQSSARGGTIPTRSRKKAKKRRK